MRVFSVLCLLALSSGTPLDDYVNKPDPNYHWYDTNVTIKTVLGGTGYVLNVTSQQWLDVSRATSPNGAIWSHQVIVVVPSELRLTNVSMAYLTGNCNDHPGVPGPTDEELLIGDLLSHQLGMIFMIVYQLPNCPIVYPADPLKQRRTEDAVIAFAWAQYRQNLDPEWLPRLPMTKAAMNCMRAVTDWTKQKGIANIEGFIVAGASKRGWTTWAVGMVNCPSCPTILGIAPLVPIVPSLHKEMHRMFQAYNGWTFAFSDYMQQNATRYLDTPEFAQMLTIIDPSFYYDRLARLPKFVVLSSDDEFMMMDWSNIWYDDVLGERHLFIVPDSEHSLITGIPEVATSLGVFASSIAHGITVRPSFNYTYNNVTGELVVTIPSQFPADFVIVHTGHTTQTMRRDFRWVRLANNKTGVCKLPDITLPKPLFGGNCLQPIIWNSIVLSASAPGEYRYTPSSPPKNWMGYYIEMKFPSDTGMKEHFQFTTPGYTWPNTLPFPDCANEGCEGSLL